MKELKALYIIVNAGFASEVVEIARRAQEKQIPIRGFIS